jgi:hypothetical protein
MNVTEIAYDASMETYASAKLNALIVHRGLRVVEQNTNTHFPIKENSFASFLSSSDHGPKYGVWWFAFRKNSSVVEVTMSGPIERDTELDGIFKTMIAGISTKTE